MQVTISSKAAPLAERDREYAVRKLQRLTRYFNETRDAHLVHSIQRNSQIVEVSLDLNGILVRAEERAPEFMAAIDLVVDKLEQQVRRLKGKLRSHKGRADAPTFASALAELPEEEPSEAEQAVLVVKRKRIAIKPMTAEEASLQMEMLHHDFFAFMDADSEHISVLYRRRDGNYGLLELEG